AAFDRIDARLLMIGKLDTQEPRVLAQLHGAEEPIRRSSGVSCSIHLPVSPLRPTTTWTKEIAGKLRRPSSRLIASYMSHYEAVRPSPAHQYFRPRDGNRLCLFP